MRARVCDGDDIRTRRTLPGVLWGCVGLAWLVLATVEVILPSAGEAFTNADVDRIQKSHAAAVADAYLGEGRNELQRGRYIRAIRLLSEAMKRGGGIEAYKLRSQAYCGRGKYAEAVADMTRVLESGSSGPDDYVIRGDAYNAQHDHLAALADYNTAINRDPLWVDAYRGRGTVYMAMERYDLAIKDFQVVIQNVPGDSEASFNMGMACMLADLPAAARSCFAKALQTESAPQRKELVEKRLAELPQTSEFEQRVGGMSGYLSRSPGPPERTPPAGSTVAAVNRVEPQKSSAGEPDKSETPARRRPPPKGLIELRKAMNGASSKDKVLSGNLTGSYMGFSWTFRFETRGRDVSATIRVHHPTGKEETHLCRGTVDGSFVDASDQDGYRFQGRLTNDLRLVGMLTTNHGRSFSVNMPLEE